MYQKISGEVLLSAFKNQAKIPSDSEDCVQGREKFYGGTIGQLLQNTAFIKNASVQRLMFSLYDGYQSIDLQLIK